MGKFTLNIPRMGYFVLVKGKGWISRSIAQHQIKYGFNPEEAKFTHIAVSGGGQWLVDPVPPKVKITHLIKRYKGYYIVIVKYKHKGYRKRHKVAFWAATHTNLGYDWFGVLAFKLKWLIKHQKRMFFCSENASWSLRKEYPTAFLISPEKIMPAHFLDKEKFTKVWEGII